MFRFTIRELVLLTTVTATSVGWWLEHRTRLEATEDVRACANLSWANPTASVAQSRVQIAGS